MNKEGLSQDLPLKEAYKLCLKYYKENEDLSVQLQYNDKLTLVAYTQQAIHGQYTPEKVAPLGALDVIGKDRRNAWAKLGKLSQDEAMVAFIEKISDLMPKIKTYIETHTAAKKAEEERKESEETEKKKKMEEEKEAGARRLLEQDQRRQIQDALNRQTYSQFRIYAEQQYPSNPDQQAVLVRQLQEQHYYQYMQQIYQQQMEVQAGESLVSHGADPPEVNGSAVPTIVSNNNDLVESSRKNELSMEMRNLKLAAGDDEEDEEDEEEDEEHECGPECEYCQDDESISPASM